VSIVCLNALNLLWNRYWNSAELHNYIFLCAFLLTRIDSMDICLEIWNDGFLFPEEILGFRVSSMVMVRFKARLGCVSFWAQ